MQLHFPVRRQGDLYPFTLLVIAVAALAGYFVLPGWLSAAVVLLELTALTMVLRPALRQDIARLLAVAQVRWMLVALAAPVVAITLIEIAHGELSARRFEGPMRLLLSAGVMLALLLARVDFSRYAAWVLPVSLVVCAAWIFNPATAVFFWGNRAATMFMDPITLSTHAVIFGFLCAILVEAHSPQPWLQRLLLLAAFVLAIAVAVRTDSRTGWVVVPIGAVLMAIKFASSHKLRLSWTLLLAVALLASLYLLFPSIQQRILEAVTEVHMYLNGGGRDTSVGVRLSLFRTNLILFAQKPWIGWGYLANPDITAIPAIQQLYTPVFAYYWKTAGGHNEYLQSMMRMGLVGLASRLLLLGIPLVIFAAAARSAEAVRRRNGFLGLMVTLAYISSGMTVEVFNLTYSNSLYALLVASFAAAALPNPLPARQPVPDMPEQEAASRLCLT